MLVNVIHGILILGAIIVIAAGLIHSRHIEL